jgi:hypothetical protein
MTTPCDQKGFCATRSVSPRTLRSWLQRQRTEDGFEHDRYDATPLHAILEALQVRLAHLEAVVGAALALAAACRAAVDEPPNACGPARCLEGEAELPPYTAQTVAPTRAMDVAAPAPGQGPVTSDAGSNATSIPSPAQRKTRGSFFDFIEDEADLTS